MRQIAYKDGKRTIELNDIEFDLIQNALWSAAQGFEVDGATYSYPSGIMMKADLRKFWEAFLNGVPGHLCVNKQIVLEGKAHENT